VIVAGIAILLWLVYRGGEDRVKAADLKGLQAEISQQSKTLADWRKESNDANDQLSKDVAAINTAAAAPIQHVWVRDSSCPQPTVLPATAAKASPQPAATGPVQPGVRTDAESDRRDSIVAEFKRRWETTLAECRSLDAQWPH
jgi:recombination DNA repair RAD52 pathway protein